MTDHGTVAVLERGFRFALGARLACAKRLARNHPVLIAAVVVVVGGGAAAAAVALNSPSAARPAGPCPAPAGGYYAYAVPQDPAHPPAANSGASSWAWTPRAHQIKVGDRLRENGRLWQVTGIAAMPGVEPIGRPFGIIGWMPPSANTSLTMCGRLIFRPVS